MLANLVLTPHATLRWSNKYAVSSCRFCPLDYSMTQRSDPIESFWMLITSARPLSDSGICLRPCTQPVPFSCYLHQMDDSGRVSMLLCMRTTQYPTPTNTDAHFWEGYRRALPYTNGELRQPNTTPDTTHHCRIALQWARRCLVVDSGGGESSHSERRPDGRNRSHRQPESMPARNLWPYPYRLGCIFPDLFARCHYYSSRIFLHSQWCSLPEN